MVTALAIGVLLVLLVKVDRDLRNIERKTGRRL